MELHDRRCSKKSFKACSISVRPDGTEGNETDCLKCDGVAEDTRSHIVQQNVALQGQEYVDDGCNPLANVEEDDSEHETNQVAIGYED